MVHSECILRLSIHVSYTEKLYKKCVLLNLDIDYSFFSSKFWEIYIKMVHSVQILIYISTTENLYEKSVSL